ncbi:unnamed protein product [Gordionus sp. m RMFG-2023]
MVHMENEASYDVSMTEILSLINSPSDDNSCKNFLKKLKTDDNYDEALCKLFELEKDSDRHFALSLIGELKKLPENQKMEAKISLFTIISEYQQLAKNIQSL